MAASTSLAEQLKKLTAPQTSLLIQKKKRASLLFDSAEAANIDRDAFYEIGISGLKELIELNKRFKEFQYSLFDETSKYFERAVETSEANEKLDKVLKEFLCLLSPYFLLKQSQKALEWLITRFRIHEHNMDDLLCLALPYHGTRLFARVIQLFDFSSQNTKWDWLHPIQRKGVPLSKTAIFSRCASDNSFLKLICTMTINTVEIFGEEASKLSTLFAFYSTVIAGAIGHINTLNNLHLTYLLPSIVAGLSSNCIDFIASAFIIIATLTTKITLSKIMLREIVVRITLIKTEKLYNEMILILNILYQSEDLSTTGIPKKAIKRLIQRSEMFIPALGDFLSAAVYSNVFYITLVRDLLKSININPEIELIDEKNFLNALLKNVRIDNESAEKLIRMMVEIGSVISSEWYCQLVQSMEYQYPDSWDNVIASLIKENQTEIINHLLGFTSSSSQLQMFQKLNDPNPAVRKAAIKFIAENPNSFKVRYLKSGLTECWNDDDPSVVEAMFALPVSLQCYTIEILQRLLLKCWQISDDQEDRRRDLLSNVVHRLMEFHTENHESYCTLMLLPLLLSSSSSDIDNLIFNVDLPFFKLLKDEHQKGNMVSNALKNVFQNGSSITAKSLLLAYDELSSEEPVYKFTVLWLFSLMFEFTDYENKLIILSFGFEKAIPEYRLKHDDQLFWNDIKIVKYFRKTKTKKYPSGIFRHFIESVINGMEKLENTTSSNWLQLSKRSLSVAVKFYSYLLKFGEENSSFYSFMEDFLRVHLTDLRSSLNFICNVYVHENSDTAQFQSLKLINRLLHKSDIENLGLWLLESDSKNILIPTILLSFSSENGEIRKKGISILNLLINRSSLNSGGGGTSYRHLVKHLVDRSEELILDGNQISLAIYTFLSQEKHIQNFLPISIQIQTEIILENLLNVCVASETPLNVSAKILSILEYLNGLKIIEKLIPFVEKIVRENCPTEFLTDDVYLIATNVIEKFSSENFTQIAGMKNFVNFCLNDERAKILNTDDRIYLSNILLTKLSEKNLFDCLDFQSKEFIIDTVIDSVTSNNKTIKGDFLSSINSFLKKVTINSKLISRFLENMTMVKSKFGLEDLSGGKNIEILLTEILERPEWRKGVFVLEFLQTKKKLFSTHLIIPILFDVLRKCMEFEEHVSMEYTKQVCLSAILNSTGKLNLEKCDENTCEKLFNIEMIVNCIRMSQNSQTHHHALMVLSHCALFAPRQVLHNIMGIFTFMGSSILRQDDSFSFQIISNIMEIIVPLLVGNNNRKFSSNDFASVVPVLKVFSSSMLDIPDHRRIPLLEKLLKITANEKYFSDFIILTLECDVDDSKMIQQPKKRYSKRMKILQQLCSNFEPSTILKTSEHLLRLMSELPHEKDENIVYSKNVIFDVNAHTDKDLRHLKYAVLTFLSSVLSSSEFLSKVTSKSMDELKLMDEDFKCVIEQSLIYIRSIMSHNHSSSKNGSSKYWKALIYQSLDILHKTNALLNSETFLNIANDLLNHEIILVRRKMMELLNWRLQQSPNDFYAINPPENLIPILGTLTDSVVQSLITSTTNASSLIPGDEKLEISINLQTALISIKLITKYCNAFDHVEEFKKVLVSLTGILSSDLSMQDPVLACLVLCIAELTSVLKVHSIESMPKFIPSLISLLEYHNNGSNVKNDIVLMSIISAFQKIVESLPNFLSPYLESILYEISILITRLHRECEPNKLNSFVQKLNTIRQKISTETASRILLPSISNCLTHLFETEEFDATKYVLDTLAESFQTNNTFPAELTNLFLNSLELRSKSKDKYDNAIIMKVESNIINALCSIVLKCSESSFRPFYHKLYDWGVVGVKYDEQKERTITYYRVMCCVSDKLKSLFVFFASNLIRNAAELLDKNNISKCCKSNGNGDQIEMYFGTDLNKSVMLVDAILQTLLNVFKHNTVKFVTKDRFQILNEPLVDQIENKIGDYEKRSELIIDCVSHFAAATMDDSLWKQFIYLVLLKTRHSAPEVRIVALETVCKFAALLGDNFLPFLPETVPFFAELLEDEVEIVERQTQKAIQKLESALGEPIQKYF